MTEQQAEDTEGGRIRSLSELADKVDWIVAKLTGGGEPKAEPQQEEGGSVGEQVRAELAKAERERAQAEAAERDKSEREDLKATVAKLAEKPPAQPVPRRQKMLGWGD